MIVCGIVNPLKGFDLQLTRYDARGWRATFYVTGMEHSPTGAPGTAWEPTPWQAVQGGGVGGAKRAWRRHELHRGPPGLLEHHAGLPQGRLRRMASAGVGCDGSGDRAATPAFDKRRDRLHDRARAARADPHG